MPVTREVTYEADAQYHPGREGAVRAIIGEGCCTPPGHPLRVLHANGEWSPEVRPGWWVVRYGPRDHAVMADGEHARLIGDTPAAG